LANEILGSGDGLASQPLQRSLVGINRTQEGGLEVVQYALVAVYDNTEDDYEKQDVEKKSQDEREDDASLCYVSLPQPKVIQKQNVMKTECKADEKVDKAMKWRKYNRLEQQEGDCKQRQVIWGKSREGAAAAGLHFRLPVLKRLV
jgi:hypothetical protein